MTESFSDMILIAKILLFFLSRIDWETLNQFYKFGNLPRFPGSSYICKREVWKVFAALYKYSQFLAASSFQ
jgi:hypothetical protein